MQLMGLGEPGLETGMGSTPPLWRTEGAVMEFGIEGLRNQRQQVVGPR
jgi:hypothetical protein